MSAATVNCSVSLNDIGIREYYRNQVACVLDMRGMHLQVVRKRQPTRHIRRLVETLPRA